MQIDRAGTLEKISRLRDILLKALSEEHSFNAKVGLLRACDALDYQRVVFSVGLPLAIASRSASAVTDLLDGLRAVDAELSAAIDGLISFREFIFLAHLEAHRRALRTIIRDASSESRGGSTRGRGAATKASSGAPPVRREPDRIAGEYPAGRMDSVLLGASAPASVVAGQSFIARFVAYLEKDEQNVRIRLEDVAAGGNVQLSGESSLIARGSAIRVVLDGGSDVIVKDNKRTFTWTGAPTFLSYSATVADQWRGPSAVLKFVVLLEGIVVAKVLLELRAGENIGATAQTVGQRFARTAFASYASSDRARVLDRLASIRIVSGMNIFLDCMDLSPNEAWKPRLEKEIATRELFMLFWSSDAKRSGWVTWESNRAYAKKGIEGMQLHPLENGVRPPRKLRGIHVADPYVDLRSASLGSRPMA